MNPVVHFEMSYTDRDRIIEFYNKAFGWESKKLGPEMGNYVVTATTEMDKNNMPKQAGAINGGFYERMKNAEYPSVVISVPDINEAIKRVEKAGGKILGGMKPGKPDDIPGVGLYISFLDSENNRVGMLQANSMNL